MTTADDNLHAFSADGQPVWSAKLPDGPLAGWPLVTSGQWICASSGGKVFRLSAADGTAIPWDRRDYLSVGQPLGASPTLYGGRILLVGRDGTLYVAQIPQLPDAATTAGALP